MYSNKSHTRNRFSAEVRAQAMRMVMGYQTSPNGHQYVAQGVQSHPTTSVFGYAPASTGKPKSNWDI